MFYFKINYKYEISENFIEYIYIASSDGGPGYRAQGAMQILVIRAFENASIPLEKV